MIYDMSNKKSTELSVAFRKVGWHISSGDYNLGTGDEDGTNAGRYVYWQNTRVLLID